MTSGRTALVIEQAQHAHSILRPLLPSFGFSTIVSTDNFNGALQLLGNVSFDMAFIDAQLGEQACFEFLRCLRFEAPRAQRRLPVLVMSPDTQRPLIEKARDCGAHGFIAKPFSRGSLHAQIARIDGDRRAFIEADTFVGPDRRRWNDPRYEGPERRGDGGALFL